MKKLTFTELKINRAAGVDASDHLVFKDASGFSPQINLIVGPNAAGKSTTARSLQTALFGDSTGRRIDANYTIQIDGETVEGSTIEAPPASLAQCVPADQNGKTFVLSLDDLARVKDTEAATTIETEVYGNVTFDELTAHAGFDARTRMKMAARDRQNAERHKNEVGRKHGEFPQLEARLKETSELLDRLKNESGLADCIEAWSAVKRAEAELERCREAAAGYDDRIVHLLDDDREQLKKRDTTIADLDIRLGELGKALATAQAAYVAKDLDANDSQLVDDELRRMGDPAVELKTLESERADADAQRTKLRERIGTAFSDDDLVRALDEDPLKSVRDMIIRLRAAQSTVDANRRVVKGLGNEAEVDDEKLQRCREALGALQNWLAKPDGVAAVPTAGKKLFVIAGIAAIAIAVGLAFVTLWALLGIIPGIAVIAACLKTPVSASDEQTVFKNQFISTGLEEPESWDRDRVALRAKELQREVGILEAAEHVAATKRQAERQLDESVEALNREKTALEPLCARFGVDLDQTPDLLQILVDAVADWCEQSRRIAGLDAKLAMVRGQIGESLANVNGIFDRALGETATNRFEADGLLKRLQDQQRLQQTIAGLQETEIPVCEAGLKNAREERQNLLKRLGLESDPDPRAVVEEWNRVRDDAMTTIEGLRDAERALVAARAKWAEESAKVDAAARDEIVELSDAELETRMADAKHIVDEVGAVAADKQDLDSQLKEIQNTNELVLAEAAFRDADQTFEAERESEIANLVGKRMLELVRKRCQRHASPTLARASDLFKRFTNDRYTLEPSDQKALLADGGGAKGLQTLEQLSSGTKVQMLLATRIAFLEQKERSADTRLPLFLDEVLCNSDDERSTAIIETALKIAEERQIFYFTAQEDEVAKWNRLLADSGRALECKEIRLPILGPGRTAASVHPPVTPPTIIAPEPGESWEDYGQRFGVPAFDPLLERVGDVHLWYLVHRTDCLFDCLQSGIDTWSQFRNRCDRLGPAGIAKAFPSFDEADVRLVSGLARGMERLWEHWRIGRGRPADRHLLEECRIRRSSFFDEVVELADSLNNDAKSLVASLEAKSVSGLRANTLDQLKEDLERLEALIPEETLTAAELREEVDVYLAACDEPVAARLRPLRDWLLSLFPA